MGTRLLVVGGDAAGMSAAMQARRLAPDLEIVAVEKGRWTSYAGCGIPYLVGGTVHTVEDLVVRSPDELRASRIDVRTGHEVVGVDLAARRAEVHNLAHGRTFQLGFDLLVLATGARPRRPPIEGIDAPHVYGVQTLEDAARLLEDAKRRRPGTVAVIGSGYIGLEMAEAFRRRGAEVTVLERGGEVMPGLDPDMGARVGRAMRAMGIDVRTSVATKAVGDSMVVTSEGEVAADFVILGTGVQPNSEIGADAGLRTGAQGGLVVDRRQRTSAEGVWAAGDCCQSVHRVSGRPVYQPLGTVANKHGRVAGINLTGGYATFPGVLGTGVTRVCEHEIGRTGLGERDAEAAGFDAVVTTVETSTMAGYISESRPLAVKMLAERGSGRLLGMQSFGGPGSAKRVDVAAAAMAGGMSVEDLVGLDLAYAPPLSTLWDPLQTAARTLLSRL